MLTKETIDKLQKVKASIMADPGLYNQYSARMPDPECGTPGCLLGHAFGNLASKEQKCQYRAEGESIGRNILILNAGADLLGLDEGQKRRLFDGRFGVSHQKHGSCGFTILGDMALRYIHARAVSNYLEAAQIACQRIDHFIATGGDE